MMISARSAPAVRSACRTLASSRGPTPSAESELGDVGEQVAPSRKVIDGVGFLLLGGDFGARRDHTSFRLAERRERLRDNGCFADDDGEPALRDGDGRQPDVTAGDDGAGALVEMTLPSWPVARRCRQLRRSSTGRPASAFDFTARCAVERQAVPAPKSLLTASAMRWAVDKLACLSAKVMTSSGAYGTGSRARQRAPLGTRAEVVTFFLRAARYALASKPPRRAVPARRIDVPIGAVERCLQQHSARQRAGVPIEEPVTSRDCQVWRRAEWWR